MLFRSHAGSVVAANGLSCPAACGILVPQPGIEPASPALEGRLFTTGPPGKYLLGIFDKRKSRGRLGGMACSTGKCVDLNQSFQDLPDRGPRGLTGHQDSWSPLARRGAGLSCVWPALFTVSWVPASVGSGCCKKHHGHFRSLGPGGWKLRSRCRRLVSPGASPVCACGRICSPRPHTVTLCVQRLSVSGHQFHWIRAPPL